MDDEYPKKKSPKKENYKKYILSQYTQGHNRYINIKRECGKEIWRQKREYEIKISLEAKRNPELFFRYVKCKKTFKDNIGSLFENGDTISDDKGLASVLSSTFSSEEDMTSISTPKNISQFTNEHNLAFARIDINEMLAYPQSQ